MSFTKMVKVLQEKNQDKIIICNLGNFYIAVGKDAIILNKIAKLRIGCTQVGTCKVGFPKTSLEKYTEIIKEMFFCIWTHEILFLIECKKIHKY